GVPHLPTAFGFVLDFSDEFGDRATVLVGRRVVSRLYGVELMEAVVIWIELMLIKQKHLRDVDLAGDEIPNRGEVTSEGICHRNGRQARTILEDNSAPILEIAS